MSHEHHGDGEIDIEIDDKTYDMRAGEVTGEELRNVPKPPIGPDRDLYLENPHGEDTLIRPTDKVLLRDEMEFFTAPSKVTPGR